MFRESRKKLIWIIPVVSLLLCFLPGCKDIGNKEGFITIYIADDCEIGNEVIAEIYQDLKPLQKSKVPLRNVAIHIEDSKVGITSHGMDMYCAVEDIQSGKYLEPLVIKSIELKHDEIWKKYAIYGYLYKETESSEGLKEYLSDADNRDILSMFIGYFIPEYNTMEEIGVNVSIAKLYGKYIIDECGLDELLSCDASDYINEWLGSMGLTFSYEDEYKDILKQFNYTEDKGYNLVAQTDLEVSFYMAPPKEDGSNVYLSRQVLAETYVALNEILNYIKEYAPEYYQKSKANLIGVNVFFDRPVYSVTGGGYYPAEKEVRVSRYIDVVHELCHAILPNSNAHQWRNEGFAEYASKIVSKLSIYRDKVEKDYHTIEENAIFINEEYTEYRDEIIECIETGDYDIERYKRISAKVLIKMREDGAPVESVYDNYVAQYTDVPKEENVDLSYDEAMFFVEYLIKKYNLSKFLEYCCNENTFEEAFGVNFESAIQRWREEFAGDKW
jgi:hypothetical protein